VKFDNLADGDGERFEIKKGGLLARLTADTQCLHFCKHLDEGFNDPV
jgi:hypothetical protein